MTRMLCAAAVLLLFAAPAVSQEQRASIEGTIRDSSGGVLPGRYEVTATLQGFQPAKSADVRLELGQILKIDLAMQVGGVSETIKVTGESPLIDVKQNTAGANVQAETIERIPKGRDFAALVTSAPGITSEARNRGIQIDGASGADNRFLIDGVDTTNLLNGTSGKVLPPDFVDTVQAKASGYSAEYRASLGGVISAITKSGGNTYHGSAGQTTPYRDGFNVSDATFFGGFNPAAVATAQNFRPDARFGMASGFQDPRVIRLQAKFSF